MIHDGRQDLRQGVRHLVRIDAGPHGQIGEHVRGQRCPQLLPRHGLIVSGRHPASHGIAETTAPEVPEEPGEPSTISGRQHAGEPSRESRISVAEAANPAGP